MHPHQHIAAVGDVAPDQGQVLGAVDDAAIAQGPELPVPGRDGRLGDPLDMPFAAAPVCHQIRDRDRQQPVFGGEPHQFRQPGHGPVVVDDLTDNPGRTQPRQPGQIHRRLGVAGAAQHPTGLRPQRKDVAGPGDVGGGGPRIGQQSDRVCPVSG